MKIRFVTRIRAQYPNQRGSWYGTCPVWERGLQSDAVVTRERVMVVNPKLEGCGACGGTHVAVPHPDN